MSVRWVLMLTDRRIEQHDKVEAPSIPETYIYLLALQSLDAVAEGIYVAMGQSNQNDVADRGMAESAWPALLAALSYCLGTNLADSLFAEVLSAVQDFTVACGLLGLTTPRDAFISTLGKYAVPPPVVSAMQSYMEGGQSSRITGAFTADALGLSSLAGGGQTGPPSLSERNLACLRSIVTTARILAPSLRDAWHDVLEILQNANFLLVTRRPTIQKRNVTGASPQIPQSPGLPSTPPEAGKPEIFVDLDTETIQNDINILFDGSRDMDDEAFMVFIDALQQLSSQMIGGLEGKDADIVHLNEMPAFLMSPGGESKRRTSGIHVGHSIKSGERSFSLTKLRIVAMINLKRLVTADSKVGWDPTTQHLLAVARHPTAPATIRLQASDALAELLLGAIRIGKESRTQHQVFDVLVKQVDVAPVSQIVSTDYDVRSSGFSTLNQILESSGHSLEVGWKTIFGMLNDVCSDPVVRKALANSTPALDGHGRPSTMSKGNANLVRIAFPSLNIICTDFLSSLDADSMQDCITCLGGFGTQKEDVNIALAAIGLLWNVSDAVQAGSAELKLLWISLLAELLELARDKRLEVRSGAMQTLFRCIELYGSTTTSESWRDIFEEIIFPLLNTAKGDESAILALTSAGNIFNVFLSPLSSLPQFRDFYPRFTARLQSAFANEPRKCGSAALNSIERVLLATANPAVSTNLDVREFILDTTWTAFLEMAHCLSSSDEYTQDNLLALVRVASLLHGQMTWNDERVTRFSEITTSIMTYDKSPQYRSDVDVMSPLQASVTELMSTSSHLGTAIVLADLAKFASLAYTRDETAKPSFVAVCKYAMPKAAEVFGKHSAEQALYDNGTVDSVLGVGHFHQVRSDVV